MFAVGRSVSGTSAPPVVLSRRSDRLVVRVGDVVVKAHPPGTDPAALAARLRIAAGGAMWLSPIGEATEVCGRLTTVWRAGTPVSCSDDPDALQVDGVDVDDIEQVPWREGAALLARLHRAEVPDGPIPPATPMDGVTRAVARLDTVPGAAAAAVRRAFRGLPGSSGGTVLIHGDWHFGQLVEHSGWKLIDIDDLGVGDPAWDLARPAALFAVGLLAPSTWACFVDTYRASRGPAIPPDGDPWPVLDPTARALVVRLAAQAVLRAGGDELDESDKLLVDACVRMCP